MKTIAYTALHYGKDYLGFAIQSVIDYVDEYWVLYSAVGSHGHRTDAVCPDMREELYWIAQHVAGDKLRWIDGDWQHEGQQRDSITDHCPDADVIIVLDADEIWSPETIGDAVAFGYRQNLRHFRVPMIHYWRSFQRVILHDPSFPTRVIYPKIAEGIDTLNSRSINHMGYAQRPEIVQYKQRVHGHKNEWRTDCNWFEDKFLANAQHDCHPVGSDYWNPEAVNPLDYMPAFMAQHPYFGMEVIE